MAAPGPTPTVLVGRITSPSGVGGAVQVEPQSDVPHRFAPGSPVWIDGTEHRIARRSRNRNGLVLQLLGIDSRAQAQALCNKALEVPIDQVPPPPPGSFYYFQLLDLEVFTEAGEHLGVVAEILPTGSNDVYVVRRGAQEVLLPALDDVVLRVDLAEGRMTVRVPEGLLPTQL